MYRERLQTASQFTMEAPRGSFLITLLVAVTPTTLKRIIHGWVCASPMFAFLILGIYNPNYPGAECGGQLSFWFGSHASVVSDGIHFVLAGFYSLLLVVQPCEFGFDVVSWFNDEIVPATC